MSATPKIETIDEYFEALKAQKEMNKDIPLSKQKYPLGYEKKQEAK